LEKHDPEVKVDRIETPQRPVSRKKTAQVDATRTGDVVERSSTPSSDVPRSNGKEPERVTKRKAADVDEYINPPSSSNLSNVYHQLSPANPSPVLGATPFSSFRCSLRRGANT
jgi:hypothetical protein